MVASIYGPLSATSSTRHLSSDVADTLSKDSHTGSKLSTCRRRLMFTPRIFHGETIYLDLRTAKDSRQRTNLESDIAAFGGHVEAFLSKEITHVITDRTPIIGSASFSSPVPGGSRDGSSRTPKPLPAAFSRAQALLQRSVSKQQHQQKTIAAATDPVSLARQWGIRVTPLHKVLQNIEREKAKYGPRKKLSSSKQTGKATSRVRKLEGAFIKFDDMAGEHRPFFKNFQTFPVIDFMDPAISHNQSPFHPRRKAIATVKPQDVGSGRDRGDKNGSNPLAITKEKSQKQPATTKPAIKKPPKTGFCEVCDDHYTNLMEHTQSDSHQKFASGIENFRSLDDIISKLPSLDQLRTGFFNMSLSEGIQDKEMEAASDVQSIKETKSILQEGSFNLHSGALSESQKGLQTPQGLRVSPDLPAGRMEMDGDNATSFTDVPSPQRPAKSVPPDSQNEIKYPTPGLHSSQHDEGHESSQRQLDVPATNARGTGNLLCSNADINQSDIGPQSYQRPSHPPLISQKTSDSGTEGNVDKSSEAQDLAENIMCQIPNKHSVISRCSHIRIDEAIDMTHTQKDHEIVHQVPLEEIKGPCKKTDSPVTIIGSEKECVEIPLIKRLLHPLTTIQNTGHMAHQKMPLKEASPKNVCVLSEFSGQAVVKEFNSLNINVSTLNTIDILLENNPCDVCPKSSQRQSTIPTDSQKNAHLLCSTAEKRQCDIGSRSSQRWSHVPSDSSQDTVPSTPCSPTDITKIDAGQQSSKRQSSLPLGIQNEAISPVLYLPTVRTQTAHDQDPTDLQDILVEGNTVRAVKINEELDTCQTEDNSGNLGNICIVEQSVVLKTLKSGSRGDVENVSAVQTAGENIYQTPIKHSAVNSSSHNRLDTSPAMKHTQTDSTISLQVEIEEINEPESPEGHGKIIGSENECDDILLLKPITIPNAMIQNPQHMARQKTPLKDITTSMKSNSDNVQFLSETSVQAVVKKLNFLDTDFPVPAASAVQSVRQSNIPPGSPKLTEHLHYSTADSTQCDIGIQSSQKQSSGLPTSPQDTAHTVTDTTQNDVFPESSKIQSSVLLGTQLRTVHPMRCSPVLSSQSDNDQDHRDLENTLVARAVTVHEKEAACQTEPNFDDLSDNYIVDQNEVLQIPDLGGKGDVDKMSGVQSAGEICWKPNDYTAINSITHIKFDEAPDMIHTQKDTEISHEVALDTVTKTPEEPHSQATIICSQSGCDEILLLKSVTSPIGTIKNTQHVTLEKTPLKDITTSMKSSFDNVQVLPESSVHAVLKELNFLNTNSTATNAVQPENTWCDVYPKSSQRQSDSPAGSHKKMEHLLCSTADSTQSDIGLQSSHKQANVPPPSPQDTVHTTPYSTANIQNKTVHSTLCSPALSTQSVHDQDHRELEDILVPSAVAVSEEQKAYKTEDNSDDMSANYIVDQNNIPQTSDLGRKGDISELPDVQSAGESICRIPNVHSFINSISHIKIDEAPDMIHIQKDSHDVSLEEATETSEEPDSQATIISSESGCDEIFLLKSVASPMDTIKNTQHMTLEKSPLKDFTTSMKPNSDNVQVLSDSSVHAVLMELNLLNKNLTAVNDVQPENTQCDVYPQSSQKQSNFPPASPKETEYLLCSNADSTQADIGLQSSQRQSHLPLTSPQDAVHTTAEISQSDIISVSSKILASVLFGSQTGTVHPMLSYHALSTQSVHDQDHSELEDILVPRAVTVSEEQASYQTEDNYDNVNDNYIVDQNNVLRVSDFGSKGDVKVSDVQSAGENISWIPNAHSVLNHISHIKFDEAPDIRHSQKDSDITQVVLDEATETSEESDSQATIIGSESTCDEILLKSLISPIITIKNTQHLTLEKSPLKEFTTSMKPNSDNVRVLSKSSVHAVLKELNCLNTNLTAVSAVQTENAQCDVYPKSSERQSNVPPGSQKEKEHLLCSTADSTQDDIGLQSSQRQSNVPLSSPQDAVHKTLCSTADITESCVIPVSSKMSSVLFGNQNRTVHPMLSYPAFGTQSVHDQGHRELEGILVPREVTVSMEQAAYQTKDNSGNMSDNYIVDQNTDLGSKGDVDEVSNIQGSAENICWIPHEHSVINSTSHAKFDEASYIIHAQNDCEISHRVESEELKETLEEPDSQATIIRSESECDEILRLKSVTSPIVTIKNNQHMTLQKTPLKILTPVQSNSDNVQVLSESSVQAVLMELNFLNTNFSAVKTIQPENTFHDVVQKNVPKYVPMECEFANGGSLDEAPILECQVMSYTDQTSGGESCSYPSMPELQAEVGFNVPELQFLETQSCDASMPEPMTSRGTFFDVSPVKLVSQFAFGYFDDPEATNEYSAGTANVMRNRVFTDNQATCSYQFDSRHPVPVSEAKSFPTSFINILSELSTENSLATSTNQQVVDYSSIESTISHMTAETRSEVIDTTMFTQENQVCSATPSHTDVNGSHLDGVSRQISGTELNSVSQQISGTELNGVSQQISGTELNGVSQQISGTELNGVSQQISGTELNGVSQLISSTELNLAQDVNMDFSDVASSDHVENTVTQNLLARLQEDNIDNESDAECVSSPDMLPQCNDSMQLEVAGSKTVAEATKDLVDTKDLDDVEHMICAEPVVCDAHSTKTVQATWDESSDSSATCSSEIPSTNVFAASEAKGWEQTSVGIAPGTTFLSQQLINPVPVFGRSAILPVQIQPHLTEQWSRTVASNRNQNNCFQIAELSSALTSACHGNLQSFSSLSTNFIRADSNPTPIVEPEIETAGCWSPSMILNPVSSWNMDTATVTSDVVPGNVAVEPTAVVRKSPHKSPTKAKVVVTKVHKKSYKSNGYKEKTSTSNKHNSHRSTLKSSTSHKHNSHRSTLKTDSSDAIVRKTATSSAVNDLKHKTNVSKSHKHHKSKSVVTNCEVDVVNIAYTAKHHDKSKHRDKSSKSHNHYKSKPVVTNCNVDMINISDTANNNDKLKHRHKSSKSHKHHKSKPVLTNCEVDVVNIADTARHNDKSKHQHKSSKSHNHHKSKPVVTNCEVNVVNIADTAKHNDKSKHRHKSSKAHKHHKSKPLLTNCEVDLVNIADTTKYNGKSKHRHKSSKSHKLHRSKPTFTDNHVGIDNIVDIIPVEKESKHKNKPSTSHLHHKPKPTCAPDGEVDGESITAQTGATKHKKKSLDSHRHHTSRPEIRGTGFSPSDNYITSKSDYASNAGSKDNTRTPQSKRKGEDIETPKAKKPFLQTLVTPQGMMPRLANHGEGTPPCTWRVTPTHGLKLKISKIATPVRERIIEENGIAQAHSPVQGHSEVAAHAVRDRGRPDTSGKHRHKERKLDKEHRRRKLAL